ncbi:uncharacterized protein SCHCODRAFT_02516171 [Schizophyllum commune H4-8]|nr:uncharacterized protein SCHCODRAFT_02516171 [Schizophyllum commune H4-8]KAI5887169.1 hypothetical protein SCHCODRAFT_02516171 [Schizophyllum commune H4-8]
MRKLNLLRTLMDAVPQFLAGFSASTSLPALGVTDTVSAVAPFDALEALRSLLSLGQSGGSADPAALKIEERLLFFHVINCVRDVWPDVVSSLNYLDSTAGRSQNDRTATLYLSEAILSVIGLKKYIPSRMEETPHIYRVVVALWLRRPSYASSDLETLVEWHAGLGAALQTALTDSRQERLDEVAARQVLAAVDHRPNDLFRQAIGCVLDLLSLRGDEPAASLSVITVREHLILVEFIAYQVAPLPCHARDVVRSLVDVTRRLVRMPGSTARSASEEACAVLLSIWNTASDSRSVVWALNDGILDAFAYLARSQPLTDKSSVLRELLIHIGERSIVLSVTRAMYRNNFEGLLGSRCLDACPPVVGATILRRISLMRAKYTKKCANKTVQLGHLLDDRR